MWLAPQELECLPKENQPACWWELKNSSTVFLGFFKDASFQTQPDLTKLFGATGVTSSWTPGLVVFKDLWKVNKERRRWRHQCVKVQHLIGFEPTTCSLQGVCSNAVLQPLQLIIKYDPGVKWHVYNIGHSCEYLLWPSSSAYEQQISGKTMIAFQL